MFSSNFRIMASLRKRGKIWEARIRWRVGGIQRERRISLDTLKEDVADIRMANINKYEPKADTINTGDFYILCQR